MKYVRCTHKSGFDLVPGRVNFINKTFCKLCRVVSKSELKGYRKLGLGCKRILVGFDILCADPFVKLLIFRNISADNLSNLCYELRRISIECGGEYVLV